MFTVRASLIAAFLLLVSATGQARERPIPAEQFDQRTHLWLSRAMVAEAGFIARADHLGIAYVLAKRWRRAQQAYPSLRFLDVLLRYAKGLGAHRAEPSARQRWVRSLTFGGQIPDAWPRNASWKRHSPLWRDTLELAERWAKGRTLDPCRGRADHWGGTIDEPWTGLVEVDCGDTLNTFYAKRRQER